MPTDDQISEDLWTEIMIAEANLMYWRFPNGAVEMADEIEIGTAVITPLQTRGHVTYIYDDMECRVREDGICGRDMRVWNSLLRVIE